MNQLTFGNIPEYIGQLRKENIREDDYTETYMGILNLKIKSGGQYDDATAHADVTVLKEGYVTPKLGDFPDEDTYRKELARLKEVPIFSELQRLLQEAVGQALTKIIGNYSHVYIE